MSAEPRLSRRRVVRGALLATGSVVAAGCVADDGREPTDPSGTTEPEPTTPGPRGARPRVLVAYFSRAGENYYYGDRIDLEVGNTAVVAGFIGDEIDCDLHEIEAADPYPDDYDATVERNVREQDSDARPGIVGVLPDPSAYDVVLLGSGIWNVRPPMIMSTFVESVDLDGVRVHPFVTHAVSGLGRTEEVYAEAVPGLDLGEALAVQGEEADASRAEVVAWLDRIGLRG